MLKIALRRRCKRLLIPRFNYSQCTKTKVIQLPQGNIKGKHQSGLYGHDYYSFEGIPYGKPPIGELRFRPSQPAEPWNEKELDCMKNRAPPVQVDSGTGKVIGSEDCLYLNVYTKHLDPGKPSLPVILYFYGGAFRTGGALRFKYGPDNLMREDIVFVVFSYRLCALGFLSLSSPELCVPGNAGLHDQLLALEWVNKYITHFNGDAKNITVMGTSAGAASVHFMMCLPQACGLFHKAIMMSGTMLNPWVVYPNASTLPCRLAHHAGYKGALTESAILKFLLSLTCDKLVRHQLLSAADNCFGHLFAFVPTVEHSTSSTSKVEGLLRRPLLQLMRNAWSKQVPLLIGGNSFEGLMMYPLLMNNNGFLLDFLGQSPTMVLPYDLYERLSKEKRESHATDLICFHFGSRTINKNNVTQAMDLFSYKLFWHGIHRVVKSRVAFAQAPTYLYRFDYDSPHNNLMRLKLCGNDIKRGVCHADELGYIFPREGVRTHSLNDADKCTISRLVGVLTAFARTGNPNCVETQSKNWSPVDQKNPFRAFNFGQKLEVQTQLEKEGLKVWNQLYSNDECLLYGIE